MAKNVNAIDISGLVKKTDYDNNISDIEGKIPSITGLATTTVLTVVEDKISNVSDLVKKAEYYAKISKSYIMEIKMFVNQKTCYSCHY